jgi:hypothetical protein
MIDLTIIMAVYGQPAMLAYQLDRIRCYSVDTQERLNLVVVDDCGKPPVDPREIEAMTVGLKGCKLLRVEQDIPWNQMGARNLGMHVSSGHCLMIDPDMVFDGPTMGRMLLAAAKLRRGHVLKYGLKHVSSGKLDMTSPNTYLIHRDDFFAVGGYDEDFAGHKGWSDVQMLDVLRAHYKIEDRPDLFAHFHGVASIPDAMVTSLDRSNKHNRKIRLKKVAQAKACGGWRKWVQKHKGPNLRFPWKQLYPTV